MRREVRQAPPAQAPSGVAPGLGRALVGLISAGVLGGCAPLTATPVDRCTAPPLGDERLYLRGTMSGWSAAEDYAMTWDCNAYVVTTELQGTQEFKIADANWAPGSTFAAPRGPEAERGVIARADAGGTDNIRLRFDRWSTLRLRLDGDQPALVLTRVAPQVAPLSDPRAGALRHDSRLARHRSPFGAVPDGTEVEFAVDGPSAVDSAALVIEHRRLEGNQEVLAYELADRIPLVRGADGRWSARRTFDAPGTYGYWFEVEIGGQRFAYQNNSAPIYWTRERGANGEGVAADLPEDPGAIRRFRLTVHARDFTVPAWAQQAVWYYVFPERFRNGDPSNDPRPGPGTFQDQSVESHAGWTERPFRPGSGDGSDALGGNDVFGGDLAGIIEKLDHLADLGTNALYMTPIFTAASNHKYDTADYRNVDPAFGTNTDFERLTREAALRGIRVVVDASFNHTGRDSLYFDRFAKHPGVGALEGGEVRTDSPFADWYHLDPNPADPDDRYRGWTGVRDLPELNEARRRYLLAVLMQVAWPGAPTVFYGDEVGVTGGEDPDNRRTFPWADEGGEPDLQLYADVRRLLRLRGRHPVLSLGDLGAPLHADRNVVVASRSLDGVTALVAVNNSEMARTVDVALPPELRGREYVNALTGDRLSAGPTARFDLPPLFGAVLISEAR